MEYSSKVDWKINKGIQQEFTKKWVDTSKLKIHSTNGIIDIRGELIFKGHTDPDREKSEMSAKMLLVESAIRSVPHVRDIRWKLNNWQKSGRVWNPNPIKQFRTK